MKTITWRALRLIERELAPQLRKRLLPELPGSIVIGQEEITNLRPLGFRTPGRTRAGRLSLSGRLGDTKVKVYTARNEQHANIRLALQDGALGRLRLPDVLVNHGDLIVERWIDGEPLSGLTLTDKAKAAELVHEALLSKSLTELPSGFLNDPGFCYLVDYLLERIGPWVHWDSVDDFVAEWKCRYSSLSPVIPARVCHPDLSEANIIREFESGDLYVVDNELLGVGRGWVLDYQNSFVHGYGFSELDHEVAVLTFIDYSWRLRHLSKALALGDFSRAKSILEPSVMK